MGDGNPWRETGIDAIIDAIIVERVLKDVKNKWFWGDLRVSKSYENYYVMRRWVVTEGDNGYRKAMSRQGMSRCS